MLNKLTFFLLFFFFLDFFNLVSLALLWFSSSSPESCNLKTPQRTEKSVITRKNFIATLTKEPCWSHQKSWHVEQFFPNLNFYLQQTNVRNILSMWFAILTFISCNDLPLNIKLHGKTTSEKLHEQQQNSKLQYLDCNFCSFDFFNLMLNSN